MRSLSVLGTIKPNIQINNGGVSRFIEGVSKCTRYKDGYVSSSHSVTSPLIKIKSVRECIDHCDRMIPILRTRLKENKFRGWTREDMIENREECTQSYKIKIALRENAKGYQRRVMLNFC